MSDAWLDLVMGVAALRREVERDALDLQGALGVAAWRLPHQLANVARVLTAPRVRHLLADEVGLGKTVQALMILNALRVQRQGRFRALIVVPDELVGQWRDELLCRGHEAPEQRDAPEEADEERRAARLAWPGRMVASEIDPARYDLLIVDELHALPRDLQARITRQGPLFTHALLLTATPPFHEAGRLVELLRVLEPARLAVAEAGGASPEEALARLQADEQAVAALIDAGGGAWEQWTALGGAPPPESLEASAAEAWCALRGVVRARRADWPHLFPAREPHLLTVEPTEAEVQRQEILWRYFAHLAGLSRAFDPDLLAQRALRSPASLRQRVTYLKGHGHERDGLLASVDPLLDRQLGDSRLDALLDLLAEIWAQEPDARILVAAGDNLTADDLAERLPGLLGRVGPPEARVEVRPARVRNQTAAVDSVSDAQHDVEAAITRFRSGESNLLIAAEVGKIGLNLQWTRHLVLYSVPWDPQDVEQWIGRVDRIGNPALWREQGEARSVRIYAIAWRGLVDERVLEVIRAAGVLERSVSLDGEAVQRVREAIRAAALSDEPGRWRALLQEARGLSRGSELDEAASPLARWLPWTASWAAALFDRLREAPALEPALRRAPRADGFEDREEALLGWLRAAEDARIYRLGRWAGAPGVRTLAYPELASATGGARVSLASLPHPQGALKDALPTPFKRVCFLARRQDLESPPRREVQESPSKVRYVHFLDHGGHLHEELVQTWRHVGAQGAEVFSVSFPTDHPAAALRGRWVRLLIASASAAELLPPLSEDADPLALAAWRADQRLLVSVVPPVLLVCAASLSEEGEAPLNELAALSLLQPKVGPGARWPWCQEARAPSWLSAARVRGADALLDARAAAQAEAWADERREAARRALDRRRYLLGVEAHQLRAAPSRGLPVELRAALAREAEVLEARRGWLGEVGGLGLGGRRQDIGNNSARSRGFISRPPTGFTSAPWSSPFFGLLLPNC